MPTARATFQSRSTTTAAQPPTWIRQSGPELRHHRHGGERCANARHDSRSGPDSSGFRNANSQSLRNHGGSGERVYANGHRDGGFKQPWAHSQPDRELHESQHDGIAELHAGGGSVRLGPDHGNGSGRWRYPQQRRRHHHAAVHGVRDWCDTNSDANTYTNAVAHADTDAVSNRNRESHPNGLAYGDTHGLAVSDREPIGNRLTVGLAIGFGDPKCYSFGLAVSDREPIGNRLTVGLAVGFSDPKCYSFGLAVSDREPIGNRLTVGLAVGFGDPKCYSFGLAVGFSDPKCYSFGLAVCYSYGLTNCYSVGLTSASCAPGSWTAGGNFPSNVVRSTGVYFPANQRFYAMGGRSSDAAGSDFTTPFEYNPGTNTWAPRAAIYPDNQVNNMACGVLTVSGTPQIYCVGGSAATTTVATSRVFSYNPVTDAITPLAAGDNWPGNAGGSNLPGGFTVFQNKLYILGGFTVTPIGALSSIYEFDPTLGVGAKWVLKSAVLPVAVAYAPTTTIGTLIYTGGGATVVGGLLTDTTNSFVYNPVADSITTIASIPRPTGETRAVNVGGKMWVLGGGRTAPNPSNQVDIYDPGLGSWSTGLPFVTARRNFPADSDGSRVFLAGGYAPAVHQSIRRSSLPRGHAQRPPRARLQRPPRQQQLHQALRPHPRRQFHPQCRRHLRQRLPRPQAPLALP